MIEDALAARSAIRLISHSSEFKIHPSLCLISALRSLLYNTVVNDTVPEACVSVANLRGVQSDPGQSELLLAGYRSGLLLMSRYKMSSEGVLQETRTFRYPLGSTPVTLKTDPAVSNMALVCCDSKLWRVTYDNFSEADPVLHRVWFTDVESVSNNCRTSLSCLLSMAFLCCFVLQPHTYPFTDTSFTTTSEPCIDFTSRPAPIHREAAFLDFAGSSTKTNPEKNAPTRFASSTAVLPSTWKTYSWNVLGRTVNSEVS